MRTAAKLFGLGYVAAADHGGGSHGPGPRCCWVVTSHSPIGTTTAPRVSHATRCSSTPRREPAPIAIATSVSRPHARSHLLGLTARESGAHADHLGHVMAHATGHGSTASPAIHAPRVRANRSRAAPTATKAR